jgi:DNA helicase II / ATP-dependent DNA helicase PcrA
MTMTDFEQAYKALNAGQRRAVDTIEGPVLVVAGPGTGKTQLLSMRAAAILRRTDSSPNNILCLTFTESAALEMRQRLINLMGQEGNRVAVHTFHSFGAETINTYPEYFYNGARFSPADELTGYELLRGIFEALPHSNPLSKTMNGEFTALKDVRAAISHLKRAGLQPEELQKILDHNQAFCDAAESRVAEVFQNRLSTKSIAAVRQLVPTIAPKTEEAIFGYKDIAVVCTQTLQLALEEAESIGKTTPLTVWRNSWCEKDGSGTLVFKDRRRIKKLRALVPIYQKYRETLAEHELFDFDDMVSLVAHTLEKTDELRLNLQEQYQYVMVDEFQDTNGAQLRLLAALTENPINEGRPNVLAVGDDDQAIYAFQGAELSNILDFAARYRNPEVVVLTDNYRSTAPILQHSRQVVTQAGQRLETMLANIRKELTAHNTQATTAAALHNFPSVEAEYRWVADEVQQRISQGTPPDEIALIARHHKQLVQLIPYLHAANIAVAYERRNNVLDNPRIGELIALAEAVVYLGEQRYDMVEELLPELLSYEFWGLKTEDLWKLSLAAYKQRRMWLELMVEAGGSLHAIAEFLIITAHRALREPCDTMLDVLIGSNEQQVPDDDQSDNGSPAAATHSEEFISPYRAFYFNRPRLGTDPTGYLTLLGNLRALRQAAASYRQGAVLTLHDFVDFIELCERTQTPVVDTAVTQEAPRGVHLMTAHKAKGLEFDTVFVLSCQDDIWGRRARRPTSSLSFPANLPIEPAGQHYDDALRLFFVAMTRAKHTLLMTSHVQDTNGKEHLLAEFLQTTDLPSVAHPDDVALRLEDLTPGWQQRHLALPRVKQETLLRPLLTNYQLSVTHLNNFIDVTTGGPQAFLLQNLLRFPQAMTPSRAYGHAIHEVLARAHTHLGATGERRPVEDILHDYEIHLQNARLSERDFSFWLEKGSDVLQAYLDERYDSFDPAQKAERDFASQECVIDGVRLTGIIDLMTIDDTARTITITDYKTGKPLSTWRGASDYDKIKLHKYKQQLLFYKLLAEHSRDFTGYTVEKGVIEFVEADAHGHLQRLEMSFDDNELADFRQLLQTVWQHIMKLEFADTSAFEQNVRGILAFEQVLTRVSTEL